MCALSSFAGRLARATGAQHAGAEDALNMAQRKMKEAKHRADTAEARCKELDESVNSCRMRVGSEPATRRSGGGRSAAACRAAVVRC